MRTIKINIDFGGFYNSIHSDNIDWKIESEECNFDTVLWLETSKSYCESYIDRLNNKLDLELKYVGLDSPKYYNFTTDKIIAQIDKQFAVNKLLPLTYDQNFLNWANPLLKSRDGFRSFYDGIADLIKISMDNDTEFEILMAMVVDWLIDDHCINEEIYDLEYELYFKEFITL